MVKNTAGGNKAKRGARKDLVDTGKKELRMIDENEPSEMYGIVSKYFGNRMCEVTCHDGVSRLCVIRAKFTGRGKSDNNISIGKFVIVGVRDWEVRSGGEKKCDLLEVYNDTDKEKLFQSTDPKLGSLKKIGKTISGNNEAQKHDDDDVEFSTSKFEYDEIMTKKDTGAGDTNVVLVKDTKINIDDI